MAGIVGTSSTASAAGSSLLQVTGSSSTSSRYVVKNTYGSFYEDSGIEDADYAGDRVVGTMYQKRDQYTYDGKVSYLNVADGLSGSDPKIHINIDYNNYVTIKTDNGAKWDYSFVTHSSIMKGDKAESGDTIRESNGEYIVEGQILGGRVDNFYFPNSLNVIDFTVSSESGNHVSFNLL